jgi:mannose-6-phosphate isomerase-like protein (cupin superfamily)
MSGTSVRRVVTGHDARGRAIIQSDAPAARVMELPHNGPTFYEIWNTRESPARIDRDSAEPPEASVSLAPPRNGTRIRVLDFPPETSAAQPVGGAQARELFAAIGAADALDHSAGEARHPHMHRTQTIDYGIVLEGEITLLVDEGETVVRAGDIVIQRGTNHGWANRSGRNCRVAFVLIDGKFEAGLG